MTAEFLSSFALLASRYDGFIVDLWGVIHDGQQPYPGAVDCLKRLRDAGKRIVLLSNAPRRAEKVAEALERMGVPRRMYEALITSGEVAHQCLADKNSNIFRPKGDRYIYMGLEKDRDILSDLTYRETDAPAEADFLLLSHTVYDNQPFSELAPKLDACIDANIPALCINPDKEVIRQTGGRVVCAGAVAEEYETKGGKVIYFGKPHPAVYKAAFKALGNRASSRILAVGDNLATDITGAHLNHIASALVTGGILKGALENADSPEYETQCAGIFAQAGVKPDYVIPAFNW